MLLGPTPGRGWDFEAELFVTLIRRWSTTCDGTASGRLQVAVGGVVVLGESWECCPLRLLVAATVVENPVPLPRKEAEVTVGRVRAVDEGMGNREDSVDKGAQRAQLGGGAGVQCNTDRSIWISQVVAEPVVERLDGVTNRVRIE